MLLQVLAAFDRPSAFRLPASRAAVGRLRALYARGGYNKVVTEDVENQMLYAQFMYHFNDFFGSGVAAEFAQRSL